MPLPYIRDILGHVDLSTTEMHARASTEAKRKVLEAAHPGIVTSDLPEWNQDPGLLEHCTCGGWPGYAEVCGRTMARAHSRSGDAAAIVGYAGTGTRFDQAITAFAVAYAGQVRRD